MRFEEFWPLAAFAARVPGAEFAVVPGAAHGIFGARPAETIGILRGWMGRHGPPVTDA